MGQKIKHAAFLPALLAAAVLLAAVPFGSVSLAAEDSSIEQVYADLPEVTVYGHGISDLAAEAYLGQEKLEVTEALPFAQTGEPIYYYVLLDVSNSMPEAYFESIKNSILHFETTLQPGDRMALYTFGEQVQMVLPEEHTPEQTQAAMMTIDNTDNRTLLFEAISMAADRAEQVPPEVCRRRVLVVISDGEDFTIGKTGAQEAQENLKQKGIPAYAYGIEDTARENINNFGEFARVSGGRFTVFGRLQAGMLLDTLSQEMGASEVVRLTAGTNVPTNRMETFSIRLTDNTKLTRETPVFRHIPDTTAPVLVRADKVADDQVEVEFSESVKGADAASAYRVVRLDPKKDKGKKDKDKDDEDEDEDSKDEDEKDKDDRDDEDAEVAGVASVNVSKDDPNVVLLTFANELKPGDYEVSCVGITDYSMESNAVVGIGEFEVEQPPLGTRMLRAVKEWYWIFLILIVIVLILVFWTIYRKVKKGRGVIYVDGKPVMASGVEIHKHVEIQEQETGRPFWMRVSVKGGRMEEMQLQMISSFIVGRSNICNLYFDDKRMSRQHFALEWEGGDIYITDLNTTNGTMVNNVRIHQRRRLQQNDKITAGSVEFVIRW